MTTKTQHKKKTSALALLLIALCVLALAGLGWLLWRASQTPMPQAVQVQTPVAVQLDEGWTQGLLSQPDEAGRKAYIDQMLADVQSLDANTVLWSARSGDAAVFRDKTKTLTTAEALTAEDHWWHKFDPLAYLMEQAETAGVQVCLLPTADDGSGVEGEAIASGSTGLPAWEQNLAARYGLSFYAPTLGDAGIVTVYQSSTGAATLLRADGQPAVLAARTGRTEGSSLVLGSYPDVMENSGWLTLYYQFAQSGPLPDLLTLDYQRTLAVEYPADKEKITTDTVFLMGTSDPAQPLTLDGQTVAREGTQGIWGVLVSLQEGENTFTLAQGSTTASVTLNRETPAYTPKEPISDGSVPAEEGQKLRIVSTLASALGSYGNDDTINMTLYQGAVAEVKESVSILRNNRNTYAYRLASGDYVLASDCTLITAEDAAFTGLEVVDNDEGDELLRFVGPGTPVYYQTWEDGVLTLRFYSASFTGTLPASTAFATGLEYEAKEDGFTLSLHFADDNPLWGYTVDYIDGGTQIYLKRAPQISSASTGPLTGVTVLLDPGHGDAENPGAMGCGGVNAPQETDVNLAEAKAAKYRLEQLGATVTLTREDNTFYTLMERVEMLNEQKPDFFISMHHNSADLVKDLNGGGGVECYWFYTEGIPLANRLVQRIGEDLGRNQRGVFFNYFYVTRSCICPAVLLETGFMTVPGEYEQVCDEANLWAEGGCVAQSILETVQDMDGTVEAEEALSAPAEGGNAVEATSAGTSDA